MVGELYALDSTGHGLRATWTGTTGHEEAQRTFNELQRLGYSMFKIDEAVIDGTSQGEMIRAFDSKATEIIAVPPITGG